MDENLILKKIAETGIKLSFPSLFFLLASKKKLKKDVAMILEKALPEGEMILLSDFQIAIFLRFDEITEKEPEQKALSVAGELSELLQTEIYFQGRISCGLIARHLEEVPVDYERALDLLTTGEIYEPQNPICFYPTLKIMSFIRKLPMEFCREVSELIDLQKVKSSEIAEMEETATQFIRSNLNLSEAARELYIHRNTLSYRLDKIKKKTGLDLRNFDEALMFRMVILMDRYVKSQNKEDKD